MDVQPSESVFSTGCSGNTWSAAYEFNGYIGAPILVYNNKAYVFNYNPANPGLGEISIYDGTTWTTKLSTTPFGQYWPDYTFVIGNKGYFGYSFDQNLLEEYNFDANTWADKTGFTGPARRGEATFSIGSKGYIVGGANYNNNTNYYVTWEYNQVTNSWAQKASFPFPAFGRTGAAGFTIGNKGYIVNGKSDLAPPNYDYYYNTLLQYDQAANTWAIKASFPGNARSYTKTFVLGGLAYAGGGFHPSNDSFRDFYKYNPSNDTWTSIPDIPVVGNIIGNFSLNGKGYVIYEYYNNTHDLELEKYTPQTCTVTPQRTDQ